MHVQHTIISVATTQGLVCTTHQRSVLYTLFFGCAHYTFMMVCYAHHKRCAYSDIGSTPYLVCSTHFSFYSVMEKNCLDYEVMVALTDICI